MRQIVIPAWAGGFLGAAALIWAITTAFQAGTQYQLLQAQGKAIERLGTEARSNTDRIISIEATRWTKDDHRRFIETRFDPIREQVLDHLRDTVNAHKAIPRSRTLQ